MEEWTTGWSGVSCLTVAMLPSLYCLAPASFSTSLPSYCQIRYSISSFIPFARLFLESGLGRLCVLVTTVTDRSLLPVRGNRPGKPVQLQEYEIKYLCTKAREIFINQPILLELEAPIKICG